MAFTKPTVTDFKTYFARDFPFGATSAEVMDSDVSKAQDQASFNVNPAFAADQAQYDILFNYMTAHYLVIDFQASSQGIAGQFNWLPASKSVGSVAEGFSIPPMILDNPLLAMIARTPYGAKYLSLIYPNLIGPTFAVLGHTWP